MKYPFTKNTQGKRSNWSEQSERKHTVLCPSFCSATFDLVDFTGPIWAKQFGTWTCLAGIFLIP